LQDFEEAEQQAKQQRVADAELAATQVLLKRSACLPTVLLECLQYTSASCELCTPAQVKSKLGQEAEKDGGGRLKAIIDTVIGNLQTSITNVHIRYEVRTDFTTAWLLLFECCHTQPASNIAHKNTAFRSYCIPFERWHLVFCAHAFEAGSADTRFCQVCADPVRAIRMIPATQEFHLHVDSHWRS